MGSSMAVCDWGRVPAEQTEDDEMRSAGRVVQTGRVVELLIYGRVR
jgi:hypothetical protein